MLVHLEDLVQARVQQRAEVAAAADHVVEVVSLRVLEIAAFRVQ